MRSCPLSDEGNWAEYDMKKIVVVGSLNVDFVVCTSALPREGQTVLGHSFDIFPGGKGANQSVALARLGAHVTHIGKVGTDDHGRLLKSSLERAGVHLSGLMEDDSIHTGIAIIHIADNGANMIVVIPGANMRLLPSDLDPFIPLLIEADFIAIQNEIPMETNLRAAHIGKEAGATVIYNPAPYRNGSDRICSLADLIVPNETELSEITGLPVATDQEIESAAGKLLEKGKAKAVVVTLGARGCLLKERKGSEFFPAVTVKAIDTTAAGDAFIAGMIWSLSEGNDLKASVRLANEIAAYAVTILGAQSSLPTREEFEQFRAHLKR
jgi:ribokinase